MANTCMFEIKVKGDLESKREFFKLHYEVADKTNSPRLARTRFESSNIETISKDEVLHIVGTCAWSVYSCFFEGYPEFNFEKGMTNSERVNIRSVCKELNVEVQIASFEPGLQFTEFYRIDTQGVIKEDFSGDPEELDEVWREDFTAEEEKRYYELQDESYRYIFDKFTI